MRLGGEEEGLISDGGEKCADSTRRGATRRAGSSLSFSRTRGYKHFTRASRPRGSTFFAVSKIAESERTVSWPALVNSRRRVTEATTRARARTSSLSFSPFLAFSLLPRVSAPAIFPRLTPVFRFCVHTLAYTPVNVHRYKNTSAGEHVTERMTKENCCTIESFSGVIFRECREIDGKRCRLSST